MQRPDSANARAQLVKIIGDCVYHAIGLKETLEEERKALEEQDMTALSAAIDDKTKCVDELRLGEQQRTDLCAAAGFSAGPEQMDQMIQWCDEDSAVSNCWQHLIGIAVDCDRLNVSNGQIIRGRQQQIESSISVLRGEPQLHTYGHSGKEPRGHALRTIAEA